MNVNGSKRMNMKVYEAILRYMNVYEGTWMYMSRPVARIFHWVGGGGGGAYLKNRDQIIINEFYAMQLPKTHETEFQPTVIKLKSGDF